MTQDTVWVQIFVSDEKSVIIKRKSELTADEATMPKHSFVIAPPTMSETVTRLVTTLVTPKPQWLRAQPSNTPNTPNTSNTTNTIFSRGCPTDARECYEWMLQYASNDDLRWLFALLTKIVIPVAMDRVLIKKMWTSYAGLIVSTNKVEELVIYVHASYLCLSDPTLCMPMAFAKMYADVRHSTITLRMKDFNLGVVDIPVTTTLSLVRGIHIDARPLRKCTSIGQSICFTVDDVGAVVDSKRNETDSFFVSLNCKDTLRQIIHRKQNDEQNRVVISALNAIWSEPGLSLLVVESLANPFVPTPV